MTSDKAKTAFGGKIGRTIADSTPHWPEETKPPKNAPNILVMLFDDVGFSDLGCYGSPIKTPTIDAIAARGLRYTGFHTTAMCSATRAALLTGRIITRSAWAALPISTAAIPVAGARSRAMPRHWLRCCGHRAIAIA